MYYVVCVYYILYRSSNQNSKVGSAAPRRVCNYSAEKASDFGGSFQITLKLQNNAGLCTATAPNSKQEILNLIATRCQKATGTCQL